MAQILTWGGTWESVDSLAERWGLSQKTALLAQALGFYAVRYNVANRLYISGGGRTLGDQRRLREAFERGSPGIFRPADCSSHVFRASDGGAVAFDAYPDFGSSSYTQEQLRVLGIIASALGLRWSPSDPVHFDTGEHLNALARGDRSWCI